MTSNNKRIITIGLVTIGLFWVLNQHDLRLRNSLNYGVEFTPSVEMKQSYVDLQKCLGKKSRIVFDELTWKYGTGAVPNLLANDMSADILVGAFDSRTNTIYLREGLHYENILILHEMTHAILAPEGGHPNWAFNGKCGNVL